MPASSLALAVVGMVLVALADFSIRQSAGRISPSLGAFIYSVAALVDVLPNAERRSLEGQDHGASSEVLAPVLVEFFIG